MLEKTIKIHDCLKQIGLIFGDLIKQNFQNFSLSLHGVSQMIKNNLLIIFYVKKRYFSSILFSNLIKCILF